MRPRRLSALTILLALAIACKRSEDGPPIPVASDPLPRPLLWAARKAGKTTYLFGTMHIGVDAEARLPRVVWEKLDAAPVVAVETDLENPAALTAFVRQSGTLRGELGADHAKQLEALIPPNLLDGIDRMKPFGAIQVLLMRGMPITTPMDSVLLSRAKLQNKEIVYLEPLTTQIALLDRWMDLRTLKGMLDHIDRSVAMMRRTLDTYLSGDDKQIAKLIDAQRDELALYGYTEREYAQWMKELLHDRNASWIPGIERIHERGDGFIAVGALHLVGRQSVLELLAVRGYTIERL